MKCRYVVWALLMSAVSAPSTTISTAVSCQADGIWITDTSRCRVGSEIEATAAAYDEFLPYSYRAIASTYIHINVSQGTFATAEASASLFTAIVTGGPFREGWIDLDLWWDPSYWSTQSSLRGRISVGPYVLDSMDFPFPPPYRISGRFPMALGQPFDVIVMSYLLLGGAGAIHNPAWVFNLELFEADGVTPVGMSELSAVPEPGTAVAVSIAVLLVALPNITREKTFRRVD